MIREDKKVKKFIVKVIEKIFLIGRTDVLFTEQVKLDMQPSIHNIKYS